MVSSQISPLRKPPRCKTCDSPMKGHKRSECNAFRKTPSRDASCSAVVPVEDRFLKERGVIMPGSLDKTRPSLVSSNPTNVMPLIHRITSMIKEKDDTVVDVNFNGVAQAPFDFSGSQTHRRALAPLQSVPTMLPNDDDIYPEHSISQAHVIKSPKSTTRTDHIAGPSASNRSDHVVDSEEAVNNALLTAENLRHGHDSMEHLSQHAQRLNTFESDVGESFVSGSSTETGSLKGMLAYTGGQPLASVVKVQTKYVRALARKAKKKGLFCGEVHGIGANATGATFTNPEPFVWLVIGWDADAVRRIANSNCREQQFEARITQDTPAPVVLPPTVTTGHVVIAQTSKRSTRFGRSCVIFLAVLFALYKCMLFLEL